MQSEYRVVQMLEELVGWTRFVAREQVERALKAVLKDDRHKVAFELSDGTRTQQQVATAAGLSQPAVSELWKKWRRLGILRMEGMRYAHVISLDDLGWEIPIVSGRRPKTEGSENGEDAE